METLSQDARHTFAMMRRHLGFTAAALVTLALGIGATTAVFSVVHGVLLRPLPYLELTGAPRGVDRARGGAPL